jgi:hypothetical protein
MSAPRNRRHIVVPAVPAVEPYTPHSLVFGREQLVPPSGGRPAHGVRLAKSLRLAAKDAKARRTAAGFEVHGAKPGLYVQFEGVPGVHLKVASLEDRGKGIEVVAVTFEQTEQPGDTEQPVVTERATVFVPDGQVKHFISRFEKYALKAPKKAGERRYEDMLDRVAALRHATLQALWTDEPAAYPGAVKAIWWEVWLRRTDGKELERFLEFAQHAGLKVGERRLEFDDRIVVLAFGSARKLSSSLDVLNDIAEVRAAKELSSFFAGEPPVDQARWADSLLERLKGPGLDAPAVCLLDTGVARAHPLLKPALDSEDRYAVDPAWGVEDDGGAPEERGHGTGMAGVALYGDLAAALAASGPVDLVHRLESVKILPPARLGPNPPDLYAAVTATAVSYPESRLPSRRRLFAMAVSSVEDRDRGQPTSWSAAIDALAAGRSFDATRQGLTYLEGADEKRRLLVVAAGNVTKLDADHLARSDLEPVHDPAQAWNALTVGAFTEQSEIDRASEPGMEPLAGPGELSPWSTTSVSFAAPWPIKPDVVAEGGNLGVNSEGNVDFPIPSLSPLTTHYRPNEKLFVPTWATSPASAQVARLCALVMAEYPNLWPEAVRALVVHSARWTPMMWAHLKGAGEAKSKRARLVRRYGFGVPNLGRALRSANDALTLVVQGTIRPFVAGKMREMILFHLPWPKAELEALADAPVRLKVTLSYFVEPNPARRGWQKRHRYQSHGLRFEMKGVLETEQEFHKRLNKRALDEEEERPATGSDGGWFLGTQARNTGSLHSDTWSGTAADLAERGVVAIYPVTGWWKEQQKRDRSSLGVRYALVVSIETTSVESDIWTPVAQEVGLDIETAVEVG